MEELDSTSPEVHRDLRAFSELVSHDLLSPLTVMNGYLELLAQLESPKGDQFGEPYLEGALRAAAQMGESLRSLKSLCCLLDGPLSLNLREERLSELFEGVMAKLKALVGSDIDLKVSFEHGGALSCDRVLLARTLLELGMNALARMPEAGGCIHYRVSAVSGHLRIEVESDSLPFTEDQVPFLFGLFPRRCQKGHGLSDLALSFCRTVVEAHGGAISFDHSFDRGSCFTILIPEESHGH